MELFVDQLTTIARAHPTRAKWVFVPTHAVGRTLGDRLVLAGVEWANVRFVTPLDVALRMGAPFLVERGIDPSEEGLGPALVMRLLLGLSGRATYFRPLANQPRMAVALWSTLKELRMAGVRAEHIAAGTFASDAKRDEVAALVRAYASFLAEHGRGDRATVFEEALLHADWCPIQPADCWTELPEVIWSPLERRLIDSMPGERIAPRTYQLPGLLPPRRLAEAENERIAPETNNALGFLSRPEAFAASGAAAHAANTGDPAQAPGPNLVARSATPRAPGLFHAGGAEAEIDEVFRRILSDGVSLDECEVVCASANYAPLVWEKALRYDWPVTTAQGIPAALTRPGRALLALADWIEDNFAAGRLRRMFQSGDVQLGDAVSLSTGRAARLLVQAEAAWGRATYRLALGRLAASLKRVAARDDLTAEARAGFEARAGGAAELAQWIETLMAAIPAPAADGLVDLQDLVAAAAAFVEQYAARASALDHVAVQSLVDAILEVRALGTFRCSLTEALHFIGERVESVIVGSDRPRPGHLHVSTLATAALSGRRQLFVVGLEEGRVFPAPFEDPVLLDGERESIAGALVRSTDRTDEAVYAALVRLAAMTADPAARVTLSYSCRDLREYRQTYASWILLQVYRVISGQPDAAFHHLHRYLGTPVSIVPDDPDRALGEGTWWLHATTRAGEPARPGLVGRYPSLAAGVRAREARASAAFTEFDGHVPAAGARLDPGVPTAIMSATQLEDAAECPFRHFLRRGLGVDAIESGDRDRDVWLDPLLRGSLLHDLYARLLRRCRDAGRRATTRDDGAWLNDCAAQALADLAVEMPPPSVDVGDRERDLFLDDLALFLEAEEALDAARTPVGFEVSFGRADQVDGESLAQAEPVIVDLGGLTLRIAGRIDRIDRVAPGTFEIIDYKTGGYWKDDWQGTFAGGTRLQHALYGLAAAELLRRTRRKATVRAAEYYFSSAKGNQERKRIETPSAAALASVLADLREVIASGLFVHAPREDACKWCHHGLACGRKPHDRANAKLADPALAPFNRLAGHE